MYDARHGLQGDRPSQIVWENESRLCKSFHSLPLLLTSTPVFIRAFVQAIFLSGRLSVLRTSSSILLPSYHSYHLLSHPAHVHYHCISTSLTHTLFVSSEASKASHTLDSKLRIRTLPLIVVQVVRPFSSAVEFFVEVAAFKVAWLYPSAPFVCRIREGIQGVDGKAGGGKVEQGTYPCTRRSKQRTCR